MKDSLYFLSDVATIDLQPILADIRRFFMAIPSVEKPMSVDLTAVERSRVIDGLRCRMAVLQRRLNAELLSDVKAILREEVAALSMLIHKF